MADTQRSYQIKRQRLKSDVRDPSEHMVALTWLTFKTGHMKKYIEVEENFREAEREAHVSLVSPSLHFLRHDRLRAWVFVLEVWSVV